jgi:4-methylaminobutanoate oxidase (formaldehyde-forming)
MVGVTVPIIPMAHEYLITRPMGLSLDLPTMRDPSLLVYYRGEVGGLVAGGYERDPAPWGLDGIPGDFNAKLLPEDWERFEPLMENAIRRVPALEAAEVIKLVNGPEAFTPDGEFILGLRRSRVLGGKLLRPRARGAGGSAPGRGWMSEGE